MTTTSCQKVAVEINEWERRGPHDHLELSGLSLRSSDTRRLADLLSQSGKLHISELRDGLSVESTSYVGCLDVDELRVIIRPKVQGTTLGALLTYAYGLHDLELLLTANPSLAQNGFQDLLIGQLLKEALILAASGLRRDYLQRTEFLASPRGRIVFGALARGGGTPSGSLPCRYHPRDLNHIHNRFLYSGLLFAAGLTRNGHLRSRCREIAGFLGSDVDPIALNEAAWGQLTRQSSRLTSAYRPACELIRLLMAGKGIEFNAADTSVALPGFLFDMNRFFQALLSRFLHEYLRPCEIEDEVSLKGMLSYDPAWNPRGKRAPMPRPDFILLKNGQPIAALDAKYRDLWEHALPRDMLYQLALYALACPKAECATILYPTLSLHATEARIRINAPNGKRLSIGTVALRPVSLTEFAALLADSSFSARTRRHAFAEYMAYGLRSHAPMWRSSRGCDSTRGGEPSFTF